MTASTGATPVSARRRCSLWRRSRAAARSCSAIARATTRPPRGRSRLPDRDASASSRRIAFFGSCLDVARLGLRLGRAHRRRRQRRGPDDEDEGERSGRSGRACPRAADRRRRSARRRSSGRSRRRWSSRSPAPPCRSAGSSPRPSARRTRRR